MKKGFTLIELLAVIVILAIIALIATPIVLSIIEDTKASATLRSAEYYLTAVEQSIMKKNLTAGGSFSPNTCEVQSNGNLLCDGKDILEIEVNGEVPSSGTITLEKGKITNIELILGNKTVIKNEKAELVIVDKDMQICKLINDVGEKGVSYGDKYQCKVRDDMETGWEDGYYFYVLSINDDDTINMIIDRNINSDGTLATSAISSNRPVNGVYNHVSWISEEDYSQDEKWDILFGSASQGPITIFKFLDSATKDWNNMLNINIDHSSEYIMKTQNNITTIFKNDGTTVTASFKNLKTRLPYESEVSNYDGTNLFLYEYMHVDCYNSTVENPHEYVDCSVAENKEGVNAEGNFIDQMYSYPTMNAIERSISNLNYNGFLANNEFNASGIFKFGVRPVITVSKYMLSQ